MAKKDGILNLSTAVKRKAVVIDGKKVELLNQEELRLDAAVRCREVLAAFRDKARMTEEGALSLSARLAATVRDVLPGIPKEIDEKLNDEQRIEIMLAFFQATPKPAAKTASQPASV